MLILPKIKTESQTFLCANSYQTIQCMENHPPFVIHKSWAARPVVEYSQPFNRLLTGLVYVRDDVVCLRVIEFMCGDVQVCL